MSELTVAAIKKLKVTELKAELSKRGLVVKGKKDELAKRLTNAILEQEDDSAPADSSVHSDAIDESDSQVSSSADAEEQVNSQDDVLEAPQADDDDEATNKVESEMETNGEKELGDNANELDADNKNLADNHEGDDWVMVEPPTKEEEEEVAVVITAQDAAQDSTVTQDAVVTQDAESSEKLPTEQNAATEDVEMKEPVTATKNDDVTVSVENADSDVTAVQSTENKTDSQKKADEEKKKPVDTMVEVEAEDGEDTEIIDIADGHVGLDGYTSDMHFIITDSGLAGHNLVKNGFSYMWAGARTNKGGKGGKIGYEVKITKALDAELHEKEAPINAVRVGWSVETSSLQLGESALSYGYESTGKVCASSSFFAYGEAFGEGDVIGTYLDLESEQKTLRYTKNGNDLGVAMSLNLNLDEKPLFPHIFIRNMKVELNFGALDEPWFPPLEEYSLLQNAGAENITDRTNLPPDADDQCEILLMVGLPNSGKSTWAKKYDDAHADKHFNIIGVNEVLERCKLEGKRRRKSDDGHDKLMQAVVQVLTKQYQLCPKKRRNFIYDQNNVYEISQTTKMQLFDGFKKKAVVVVPTHDNLRRRSSDAKRKGDNIHDVPFGDLCDMKCEFHLPVVGELFDEIVFPELDEKNASKTIRDYKSDGTRAKRTGRDEYYPSKRPRNDHGRNRDRYSGGHGRRDDGWKNSGSGYGDGNKGRSNYGSGGYHGNRNSGGQYQDPYRRNSGGGGGGGGYRQHQSYGSSGYRGNYGSSGYNTGSSYGGGYGSYGASSYGSSGYGSTGGNYNYGNYQSSNASDGGTWGQYGSGQYASSTQPQSNQWGSSNTTSNNWGGYNYNNSGSGNSYGGSGYSY